MQNNPPQINVIHINNAIQINATQINTAQINHILPNNMSQTRSSFSPHFNDC